MKTKANEKYVRAMDPMNYEYGRVYKLIETPDGIFGDYLLVDSNGKEAPAIPRTSLEPSTMSAWRRQVKEDKEKRTRKS